MHDDLPEGTEFYESGEALAEAFRQRREARGMAKHRMTFDEAVELARRIRKCEGWYLVSITRNGLGDGEVYLVAAFHGEETLTFHNGEEWDEIVN